MAVTRSRARVVTLVALERARELGIKAIGSGPGADPGSEVRRAARPRLIELAEEAKLTVFVGATYPLYEAAAAHRALAAGRVQGKIALIP